MPAIPTTSTTLLRELAQDTTHARWGEFVARYRPMMESFVRERFPSLDAEEVVQETLIELIRVFPVYRYDPEEKGSFRNYLTGILRHKALRILKSDSRRATSLAAVARDAPHAKSAAELEEEAWRKSLLEIALRQLLADESVHARTREVFRRVAVNGERPEEVGAAFGIARNAVDQMKSRMMARLKELVRALERADGV
ncbi:MAG: sigma-70 family RNA polymerase sigma factor [Kiritimatiellae bacterium]|nr:sigma-70 family RNA polymerase sigma factor [Kiritimatiellia bacterium]